MIHLYIKQCSHCELLYFGRTTSDPYTYPGSGVYWRRHLAKHRAEAVTLKVRSFRSQERCSAAALRFSKRYSIVEARTSDGKKVWANQIAENGRDGGSIAGTLSKASRRKMSKVHAGRQIYNDGERQYKLYPDDPLIEELNLEPGFSPRCRTNLSAALKGKTRSKEHCENIRKAKLGVSPNLTEEQRAHRRFLSSGKNNGMYGRTHTTEVRAALAEAAREQLKHRNPMDSAAARAKISAHMKLNNPARGKKWYTDGVNSYLLLETDPATKKLRRGRTL